MSPEEPVKDWQYLTERATNHLFFVELIKGCEFRTHLPFVCSPMGFNVLFLKLTYAVKLTNCKKRLTTIHAVSYTETIP